MYIGKYYLQEIKTDDSHVLDEKEYDFEIKYKDQYTPIIEYNIELNNFYKKGSLEFTKTSFVNSEAIPNTLIEIYNSKDEVIFSGRTDEKGMIVIPELIYGKYYIVEKETASPDYILNNEKMYFEILEDGKIVKAAMYNEKVVFEVPNTEKNDSNIFLIIGILLIISGGVILYGKNKK